MELGTVLLIAAATVGVIVAVLIVTPSGRNALKTLFRASGASADQAAKKLYTAELRRQELKTLAAQEARQQTAGLETSQSLAETVIAQYERAEEELKQHEANKLRALANLDRLTTDEVPDDKQVQEIGMNEGFLLQAEQAIQAKRDYLEGMRPKVEALRDKQAQASALKRAVLAEKVRKEQAADTLAADITGNQVDATIHQSMSAVPGSAAGKAMNELERMADETRGAAKAARDTFQQMPASPDITAALLNSTPSNRKADAARLLAEYRANKAS